MYSNVTVVSYSAIETNFNYDKLVDPTWKLK